MPDTTEPSEPPVPSNPVLPPPNAGRGGYNGSPNPAIPPTTSVPSPNPNVTSPDPPSFSGRGGHNVSPGSTSPVPAPTIPYPPPNTHLEQPQPIHPTFGGRGGYHTSPQSQSPVPTFAIGRHSPPSDNEHGGFGGRGGYHAGQGPEPAPMPSHPVHTFAEYEAEHGHGAGSRKGSLQEGPEPGFGGRGGYHTATGSEAPPAPGSLHHTPTFAEYEAAHEHTSLSRKGSVQEGPGPGFGGRGGYQATTGPEKPLDPLHRAATFAEYEQEHGHGTETRKGSVALPQPGFGGRGGYHADPTAALSPEGPFNAPHRAQTFSEYEAEHKGTGSRKASLQEGPQPGFGGRGGYHADPTAAQSPEAPFNAPHRAQTFAEYEAEHHGPISRKATPEHGFGGRGGYHTDPTAALSPEGPFGAPHRAQTFSEYEAEHKGTGSRKASLQEGPQPGFGGRGGYHTDPTAALSPEGPFGAPHRAQTFADYEAEHTGAAFRKLSLQDGGPEHGFGGSGRGGYHASSGSGAATPSEPPFGAPHRAQTFADYEHEHGRGTESRKSSVPPSERRGSFPPREEEEEDRPEFGGRGGYNRPPVPEVEVHDHERGAGGQEMPGHPGFGGRGGYNGQR